MDEVPNVLSDDGSHMMNTEIWEEAQQWKSGFSEPVRIATPISDDGDLVELTWDRSYGGTAYIELYPDSMNGVVLAQYGMICPNGQREQRGIGRFQASGIKRELTNIKTFLDQIQRPQPKWSYQPTVEIGRVSSLKFR